MPAPGIVAESPEAAAQSYLVARSFFWDIPLFYPLKLMAAEDLTRIARPEGGAQMPVILLIRLMLMAVIIGF